MNLQDARTVWRIESILLISIFSGIAVIQIVNLLTPAPQKYIFDVYRYFSPYYWILIVGLLIVCGIILSYFSFNRTVSNRTSLFFFASFLITVSLFLQNKLLLFFTGVTDPLAHVGYIQDILISGHLFQNPYPATHILAACISMLLGLSPIPLLNFMPVLLFSIYFLSMWLIGRSFLTETPFFYFFMALATLPVFGYIQDQFWPNMALIFFTPFIVYILFRCNSKYSREFFILWMLVLLFVCFGHELYSIIWVFLLAIVCFLYFFYRSSDRIFLAFLSIILISTMFYYLSLQGVQHLIPYVFDLIFHGGGLEGRDTAVLASNLASIRPTSSIEAIFRRALFGYGMFGILSLISGIMFFYLLIDFLRLKQKINFFLAFSVISSLFLYVLGIFNSTVFVFESIRIYGIGYVFTIISIPLFLDYLKKKYPLWKTVMLSWMIVFFSVIAIISVFTIHSSIYFSNYPNEQITESQYDAMTVFFNYREYIPITQFSISAKWYNFAIFGFEHQQPYMVANYDDLYKYLSNNTFADVYGPNSYLLYRLGPYYSGTETSPFSQELNITYYTRRTPASSLKGTASFKLLSVLNKLEGDRTADMIFSDSYTYVYYIR